MPKLSDSSSSENEPDEKEDNLHNCAILNDSFILSPNRNDKELNSDSCSSTTNSREGSELKQKIAAKADATLSFVGRFDKMAIKTEAKSEQKPCTALVLATPQQKENPKLTINLPGGLQSIQEDKMPNSSIESSNGEGQFATPQVRSFSVQRRPRDLVCSTQTQKTRSAMVNEFRSQKVLFQTPMAVSISRAPLAYSNDSISLLCDTINEVDGTPNTSEKKEEKQTNVENKTAKSKKSLEGAFKEIKDEKVNIEKETKQPKETASSGSQETKPIKQQEAANPASSTVSTVSSSKDSSSSTLQINNNEYVLISKLGCGGSSSVYLAKNKKGQECALKVYIILKFI